MATTSSHTQSMMDGNAGSNSVVETETNDEWGKQFIQFVTQIQGILTLSQTLNRDSDDMLLGYRSKLESGGGDIAVFDQAMAMVCPMKTKNQKPAPKKKPKGRR